MLACRRRTTTRTRATMAIPALPLALRDRVDFPAVVTGIQTTMRRTWTTRRWKSMCVRLPTLRELLALTARPVHQPRRRRRRSNILLVVLLLLLLCGALGVAGWFWWTKSGSSSTSASDAASTVTATASPAAGTGAGSSDGEMGQSTADALATGGADAGDSVRSTVSRLRRLRPAVDSVSARTDLPCVLQNPYVRLLIRV